MWGLLLLKAIQALPVDDTVEDDFVEESSVLTAMLTTLMQAVMVSLMSLMFLYAIAFVKSRALSRGTGHGAASLVSDQRLFRLDQQHPIALIRQTQPNKEEDTQKRRKIGFGEDLESIPLWQVPKVKSHRTNH